jgi:hypothetical protein
MSHISEEARSVMITTATILDFLLAK